ncbi:IS5 family transposase [Candidatus Pacearchaeota archaeon]|nr:IS5 family transposase [Candidatus Pacearchaeota archaeon]
MEIITSKFKKLADFCYELFGEAGLMLYKSKFSNKLYTQYQHLFLLVYKQFRKFTYKELLEDLSDNITLRAYLGLNKLPEYTTLIKFAKRLPNTLFDKLMTTFGKFIQQPEKVAIDGTGISLDNASPHYCKRIGRKYHKRPFLKLSIIIEIEMYIILQFKVRKKARHDLVDAYPMVRKLAKQYKPEAFYGDRGYDSEKLFKLVFEELGAYPLILQKRLDVPKHRRKGRYRKETIDEFDYGEYLQRNKVETAFSILKRKFGFSIKSKNVKNQKVEAMARIIAYNIDRLLESGKGVILMFIRITRVSY